MAVGFFIDPIFYEVGSGDFLNSFFSTIYIKLENNEWGSKYPYLMNNFYKGCVKKDNIEEFRKEIVSLRKDLEKLPPSAIVWDYENLDLSPPWGNIISSDIKNMSDYFVTSDGENLLDVLEKSIGASTEIEEDLCIKAI